jgi:hypothetical protein
MTISITRGWPSFIFILNNIVELASMNEDQVHALTEDELNLVGVWDANILVGNHDACKFLAKLKSNQVQYIRPELFTRELIYGIEYLSSGFYASLTGAQMRAMSKPNLIHLGIPHIKSLSLEAIYALTKEQFLSIGSSTWGNQDYRCTSEQLFISLNENQRNKLSNDIKKMFNTEVLSDYSLQRLGIVQLASMTEAQVHELTPDQLKSVGELDKNILLENHYACKFLAKLETEQVRYIKPELFSAGLIYGIEYFQSNFYEGLTGAQMEKMSDKNLIHLGISHIKSLSLEAIFVLTKEKFQLIGSSDWGNQDYRCTSEQLFVSLNENQRNQLSADIKGMFKPEVLSDYSLKRLGIVQLASMTEAQVHELTPDQLKSVGELDENILIKNIYAPKFLSKLKADQIQYIRPELFHGGAVNNIENLSSDFYAGLTKNQMWAMTNGYGDLSNWGIQHLNRISVEAISGIISNHFFTDYSVGHANGVKLPEILNGLTHDRLAALRPMVMSLISKPNDIALLLPATVHALTPIQINQIGQTHYGYSGVNYVWKNNTEIWKFLNNLDPGQIKYLPDYIFSGPGSVWNLDKLSPDFFSGLTDRQMQGATIESLKKFSPTQANRLSANALSVLSPEQLKALGVVYNPLRNPVPMNGISTDSNEVSRTKQADLLVQSVASMGEPPATAITNTISINENIVIEESDETSSTPINYEVALSNMTMDQKNYLDPKTPRSSATSLVSLIPGVAKSLIGTTSTNLATASMSKQLDVLIQAGASMGEPPLVAITNMESIYESRISSVVITATSAH